MAGFASTIYLGKVGASLSLGIAGGVDSVDSDSFSGMLGNGQVEGKNVHQEIFTTVLNRFSAEFAVSIKQCSETKFRQIVSLAALREQEMEFIFADDWMHYADEYTTDALQALTMDENSYLKLDKARNALGLSATVTIDYVDDVYSATGGTTGNLYSAFNRATWVISLSSSPGAIGTKVWVDWKHKGALVKFVNGTLKWNVVKGGAYSGAPLYNISFSLKGV